MQSPFSVESERGLRALIILTIALWIAVGCLIFACAIFQFRPHYRQTLAWGAVIVIAGSAIPQLLPKCRGHKWLKWVRAVSAGIVIAGGTFVSTYGWNERNRDHQERALLKGIAFEWKHNGLRNTGIEFSLKCTQECNYVKHYFFPLPMHWQIERAVDIAAFDRPSREYSPLSVLLLQYIEDIDVLCLRINKANQLVSVPLSSDAYRYAVEQMFRRNSGDTILNSGEFRGRLTYFGLELSMASPNLAVLLETPSPNPWAFCAWGRWHDSRKMGCPSVPANGAVTTSGGRLALAAMPLAKSVKCRGCGGRAPAWT